MKQGRSDSQGQEAMEAAASARQQSRYRFRLFIAGPSSQSTRAAVNVRKLCEQHLNGRYDLEVVDICETPEVAAQEQILAVPTLVKIHPLPLRRFVGDMSNTSRLISTLHLERGDGSPDDFVSPAA